MKNLMKVKRIKARRSCPKMKPLAKDQEDWPWAAGKGQHMLFESGLVILTLIRLLLRLGHRRVQLNVCQGLNSPTFVLISDFD